MANVGDFTTFILGAFKSEDDGRVALYHFLKNFYPVTATVSPELINEFYSEAMQLNYWQEKKHILQADVQEVIQRFFSQANEPFRLDQLWDLGRLQLISITHIDNLCSIIREFENRVPLTAGESVRVLPETEARALSIRRTNLGEVTIRTFSNLARLQQTKLQPLAPDQEIFYDPGMELKRGMFQKLRPSLNTQVRFMVDLGPDAVVSAQFVNGFAFRQTQAMTYANINQESRIFFPLKRLERFYIYRPSDPYYMELISTIERALLMLQGNKKEAFEFARQTFDSGQIAFDQIFPDDKALYSRLRELAKWISSPAVRNKYAPQESPSNDTSPN